MNDPKRSSLLSQLIPDEIEQSLGLGDSDPNSQATLLAAVLKGLIGPNSGPLGEAVNQFLEGKGELVETTRTAMAGGTRSAQREVASFLTKTFDLNAATAKAVAPVLIRIFPIVGKLAGEGTAEKPKPRRKPRTSASSSAKPAASKPKKPKSSAKKTANSSGKPKKPAKTGVSKPKKRQTTS